jgi:regulator of cell morphogenesis and NO signaling
MKMELEQHLITEEEMVFPLIRKAEQTGAEADISKAVNTIEELEADHSAVGTLLKEMRAVTQDYRLPEGACRTYTLTFQKLEELESDLFEHIHLENNVLFPRVKR